MANNIQEVQRLLGHIPYGKSNAIHAEDIALQLGYPNSGNQVETRQLIRYAIQQGNIILSTPANGYWRSNNKQEVIDYINALLSRADDILTRSNEIKSAWNSINPNNLIP